MFRSLFRVLSCGRSRSVSLLLCSWFTRVGSPSASLFCFTHLPRYVLSLSLHPHFSQYLDTRSLTFTQIPQPEKYSPRTSILPQPGPRLAHSGALGACGEAGGVHEGGGGVLGEGLVGLSELDSTSSRAIGCDSAQVARFDSA